MSTSEVMKNLAKRHKNNPNTTPKIMPCTSNSLRMMPEHNRDWMTVEPAIRQHIDDAINNQRFPITMTGLPGVGKTCAALCLMDRFENYSRRYRTVGDMNSEIIAAQNGELDDGFCRVTPLGWWQIWTNAFICVLDEIGSRGVVTDAHYENVKRAIDSRHARLLVLISNKSLDEIEKLYDDRIASRMAAGTVIEFDGEDKRLIQE